LSNGTVWIEKQAFYVLPGFNAANVPFFFQEIGVFTVSTALPLP
jgi:hypothetical protein